MSSAFVTQLPVLGAKKVFQFLNHSDGLEIPLQERETRQELNCALLCKCGTTIFFRHMVQLPTLENALCQLI